MDSAMRFSWPLSGFTVLLQAGCSDPVHQMERGPLANPDMIPEVVLVPGVEHRVQRTSRSWDRPMPPTRVDDPSAEELGADPDTGEPVPCPEPVPGGFKL
jgi:hypothetical protein